MHAIIVLISRRFFFYPNVVFAQHIVLISMWLLIIYLYFIILFFFSQVSFSICWFLLFKSFFLSFLLILGSLLMFKIMEGLFA